MLLSLRGPKQFRGVFFKWICNRFEQQNSRDTVGNFSVCLREEKMVRGVRGLWIGRSLTGFCGFLKTRAPGKSYPRSPQHVRLATDAFRSGVTMAPLNRKRGKVERLFAWLNHFWRLLIVLTQGSQVVSRSGYQSTRVTSSRDFPKSTIATNSSITKNAVASNRR